MLVGIEVGKFVGCVVGADDGMNLLKTNGNAKSADDARVYEDPERPGYWKFRDDADVDKVVEYLLSLK